MLIVFLKMFEIGFKRPLSSFLLTLGAGVAIGVFCPVPWILGVSAAALAIFVLSVVLFTASAGNPSSGLGAMIFFAPMLFCGVLLLGIGTAYYLATGQTGIQDAFGYFRSLTN